MLEVKPLSTSIYHHGEDLEQFVINHVKDSFAENDILAITSKIVSLAENRIVDASTISKKDLVIQEADQYICETALGCHLTIKHGQWIPSAGIDESNSEKNHYILYPIDPFASAKRIHSWLRKNLGIEKCGVLITDSRTLPLRRGVVGTALSYFGFQGVEDKIGQTDLFGKELRMTQINVADALAVAATYTMGEGGEGRPLAIVQAPVDFDNLSDPKDILIPLSEDLYRPILEN